MGHACFTDSVPHLCSLQYIHSTTWHPVLLAATTDNTDGDRRWIEARSAAGLGELDANWEAFVQRQVFYRSMLPYFSGCRHAWVTE